MYPFRLDLPSNSPVFAKLHENRYKSAGKRCLPPGGRCHEVTKGESVHTSFCCFKVDCKFCKLIFSFCYPKFSTKCWLPSVDSSEVRTISKLSFVRRIDFQLYMKSCKRIDKKFDIRHNHPCERSS